MANYGIGDVILVERSLSDIKIKGTTRYIVNSGHPFVVVDMVDDTLAVSPVSSQNKYLNAHHPHNIEIKDYKECGLVKPCHVKTDKRMFVSSPYIKKKIGTLSKSDLSNVLLSSVKVSSFKFLENYNKF